MRIAESVMVIAAMAALASCGSGGEQRTATHHGRYLGIGIYSAGRMWSQMAQTGRPVDASSATTADDEQVIVVVDSHTGEVRQCGNLTGYCIGLNPWSGAIGHAQATPVRLEAHADDLDREADAGEATPDEAVNAAPSNTQSR